MREAAFDRLPSSLVKVVVPEVVIWLTPGEQIVGKDENRVCDCDSRVFLALAGQQALVLRSQVSILGPSGGLGGLDESNSQSQTPFARGRRTTFACAFVVPRREPCPGSQVGCRWEALKVHADFGDDDVRDTSPNPEDSVE